MSVRCIQILHFRIMSRSYGIEHYCIEVLLNGITSVPNFMKVYQAVPKLLVGDTQTD
jgi:hypothetical protein